MIPRKFRKRKIFKNNDEGKKIFVLNQELKHTIENDLAKLEFVGYNGGAVDLASYGFDHPVYYDIAGIEIQNKIPILYNHYDPIGHTTSVTKVNNNSQLIGSGIASYPGERTQEVVTALKNGFPFQGSMGLEVENINESLAFTPKGTEKVVNGTTRQGPFYVFTNSVLDEMTVTRRGRDKTTSFQALSKEELMTIQNSVDEKTTPPVKVENTPVAPVAPVVPPVKVDNQVPPVTPIVSNAKQLAQMARLMNTYSAPEEQEVVLQGIENGWDKETIERQINSNRYLNNLPKPPSKDQPSGRTDQDVLTARFAACLGISHETLVKKFDEKTADLASKNPASIVEVLVNVANSTGGNYTGFSDIESICTHIKNETFGNRNNRINNMGFSIIDMPNLLERATNFMLEERWAIQKPMALEICKHESNKDFRKTERIRPSGGEMWKHLNQEGKIELTSFGKEQRYLSELDTVAQLVVFDRKTLTNDDTGTVQSMLDMMVEGAIMVPDFLFGKKVLVQASGANTFWVDADNSRTSAALSRTNFKTWFDKVRQYSETRGDKTWTNIVPGRWTYIHSLEAESDVFELFEQQYIVNDTTANTKTGERNYWYRKVDTKMYPQMSNTGLLGSGTFVSTTTGILWPSDPRFSPLSLTFLDNKKTPTIDTVPLPGDMLGTGVRGFWDININERERQAILRHKA